MQKILGALVLFMVIAEHLLFENLMESSKDLTLYLRSFGSPQSDWIFDLVGKLWVQGLLLVTSLDFMLGNRTRGQVTCLASFSAIAVFSLAKNVFRHPRPDWVYPEIASSSCSAIWGMPSGHSLSTSLVGSMYAPFFPSTLPRVLMNLGLIFIGLNRIYLGVHTYSQVIFGYLLGLLVAEIIKEVDVEDLFRKFPVESRAKYDLFALVALLCGIGASLQVLATSNLDPRWQQEFSKRCKHPLDAEDINFKLLTGVTYFLFCYGFVYSSSKSTSELSIKPRRMLALCIVGIGFPLIFFIERILLKQKVTWSIVACLAAFRVLQGFLLGHFPHTTKSNHRN